MEVKLELWDALCVSAEHAKSEIYWGDASIRTRYSLYILCQTPNIHNSLHKYTNIQNCIELRFIIK